MSTLFIGQNVIRLEETISTNSHANALMLQKILPDGTVIMTKSQLAGRGQRGAGWHSEDAKNLTISIVLYPSFLEVQEQFRLNMAIALGVSNAIKLLLNTEKVCIKWPNDILIEGEKIAGILIESIINSRFLNSAVVGIGLNVNQENFPEFQRKATSLKLKSGRDFDLEYCLKLLLNSIEASYLVLKSSKNSFPKEDYLKNLYQFEQKAPYRIKGQTQLATISGISPEGRLIMEIENDPTPFFADLKEVEFLS